MTTERYNPLKDAAIEQTLRGLADVRRMEAETGKPEKTAEKLFERAISRQLKDMRTETRRIKPH